MKDEKGYYATGDIGEKIDDKIIIIDRMKNVIKLSQGEFVCVENLENQYIGHSKLIEQIFIYGNSLKSFLIGVIVPNKYILDEKLNNLSTEINELSKEKFVKDIIRDEILNVGNLLQLQSYEKLKDFIICFDVFSVENGFLTPTMKLQRNSLYSFYKNQFQELYGNLESNTDQVKQILNCILNSNSNVNENSRFIDLGGDSLALTRLSSMIKEHLGIELPNELLTNSVTIKQISDYVSNINQKPLKKILSSSSFSSDKEAALHDLQLRPKKIEFNNDDVNCNDENNIFITGATGFLGAHLLYDLSTIFPDRKIYSLVRASDDNSASNRLFQCLKDYEILSDDVKDLPLNIIPVAGNLSVENFGFSETFFKKLCLSVELIYHCGAWVNWIADYRAIRSANVLGSLTVLSLALNGKKSKKLHYISTISTAASEKEIFQSPLEKIYDFISSGSGYGASKCVAEKLTRDICEDNHIFYCIYRPGMITAHSIRGVSNSSDFISRLLFSMATTKKYINESNYHLDMTPVDVMSAVIAKISLHDKLNSGSVFHLVNPHPLSYAEIGNILSERFGGLLVKFTEWRTELFSCIEKDKLHPLAPLKPFFTSLLELGYYETKETTKLLGECFFDENSAHRIVNKDYVIRTTDHLVRKFLVDK